MSYAAHDLIACHPNWQFADFQYRATQITDYLQQNKIKAIAIWLEDASHLACLTLACWKANTKILFVPNIQVESLNWGNEYADFWVTDSHDFPEINHIIFDELAINVQPTQNYDFYDRTLDTELWFKTSGSTGTPKTIVKTAAQMWLMSEVVTKDLVFETGSQVTMITTVSVQHIYGFILLLVGLINGWKFERKQQFFVEDLCVVCKKAEKAVVVSSPTLLHAIDWETSTLPNVLAITSAGGFLSSDIATLMRKKLPYVIDIYGTTETGYIAQRFDNGLWQAYQQVHLGSNEEGAIWVEASWMEKRFQTADAVVFHENGFELLGRMDRIVKIGDKRTSLIAVENELYKHPWAADCCISQHPEQQRLAAWIELTVEGIEALRETGRKTLIDDLRSHLGKTQEKIVIPRFWRFTDKLPRNSQAKISKLEFDRVCREKILDPIWLNENLVDNQMVFHGKIPIDLHYFRGHFDSFPLVAGVVELQWVIEKIAQFNTALSLPMQEVKRIDNLKFQKFVRPNDEFQLILKWDSEKNRVVFQLKTQGENLEFSEMCSSGLVIF